MNSRVTRVQSGVLAQRGWCPEPESNRHGVAPADFKSDASTSFAIRACSAAPIVAQLQNRSRIAVERQRV